MNSERYSPRLVGARIKALRRLLEWSQQNMADELGVHRELVSRWERGKSYPAFPQSSQLCERCGVTLDFIYLGEFGAMRHDLVTVLEPLVAEEISALGLER